MKKEYILLLISLLIITACEKKENNSIIENKYKNIVCYKEIEEDNIVSGSRIDAIYDENKLYKLTFTNKVMFNNDSVKYLSNEKEYFKEYYEEKNKINGISAKFESDDTSYTGELLINYDIISSKNLKNLDINYKFDKNTKKEDLMSTLKADKYICE